MKLNTIIYTVLAILIVGGGVWLFIAKSSQPATIPPTIQNTPAETVTTETILMKPDTFEPAKLTIKKNTKVVFKNEDSVSRWPASNIHPTHGIYPEFDPRGGIEPGGEWSFIFDKVGIWKMHDHLIPSIFGEVVVEE